MENLETTQPPVLPKKKKKRGISNQELFWLTLTLALVLAAFQGLLGSPVSVEANQEDPILIELQNSYEMQSQAIAETHGLLYTQQIGLCELEKAIAQYKIAENYEPERQFVLRDKTEQNCDALF